MSPVRLLRLRFVVVEETKVGKRWNFEIFDARN